MPKKKKPSSRKKTSSSWDAALDADRKRQEVGLTSHQKRSKKILESTARTMAGVFGPQEVRGKGRSLRKAKNLLDIISGAGTKKRGRVKRGTFIKKMK